MEGEKQGLKEAVARIAAAKKVTALTGSGISVASGIMTFRGKGGLWEKYDPEEVANIDRFLVQPGKAWVALKEIQVEIEKARPNAAHLSLARLEAMGYLSSVITQNVDGLHQEAGNKTVIEFHGNTRRLICLECRTRYPAKEISLESLPPFCPSCRGLLKPDAVFFGEAIPRSALLQAHVEAQQSEVMLVIGTSAMVEPAAGLPLVAKRNGAVIIEVNPESSNLTGRAVDIFLQGKSEEVLPLLVDELSVILGS